MADCLRVSADSTLLLNNNYTLRKSSTVNISSWWRYSTSPKPDSKWSNKDTFSRPADLNFILVGISIHLTEQPLRKTYEWECKTRVWGEWGGGDGVSWRELRQRRIDQEKRTPSALFRRGHICAGVSCLSVWPRPPLSTSSLVGTGVSTLGVPG